MKGVSRILVRLLFLQKTGGQDLAVVAKTETGYSGCFFTACPEPPRAGAAASTDALLAPATSADAPCSDSIVLHRPRLVSRPWIVGQENQWLMPSGRFAKCLAIVIRRRSLQTVYLPPIAARAPACLRDLFSDAASITCVR